MPGGNNEKLLFFNAFLLRLVRGSKKCCIVATLNCCLKTTGAYFRNSQNSRDRTILMRMHVASGK